jgi:hypothetical protein
MANWMSQLAHPRKATDQCDAEVGVVVYQVTEECLEEILPLPERKVVVPIAAIKDDSDPKSVIRQIAGSVDLTRKRDDTCSGLHAGRLTSNARGHNKQTGTIMRMGDPNHLPSAACLWREYMGARAVQRNLGLHCVVETADLRIALHNHQALPVDVFKSDSIARRSGRDDLNLNMSGRVIPLCSRCSVRQHQNLLQFISAYISSVADERKFHTYMCGQPAYLTS